MTVSSCYKGTMTTREELNTPLPFMEEFHNELLSCRRKALDRFKDWLDTDPAGRAWEHFCSVFASGAFNDSISFEVQPCKDGFVDCARVLWRGAVERPATVPPGDFRLTLRADFPRTSLAAAYENAVETGEFSLKDVCGPVRFHFHDELVIASPVGEEFAKSFCEGACSAALSRYRLPKAEAMGGAALELHTVPVMPDVHKRFLRRYLDERYAYLVG